MNLVFVFGVVLKHSVFAIFDKFSNRWCSMVLFVSDVVVVVVGAVIMYRRMKATQSICLYCFIYTDIKRHRKMRTRGIDESSESNFNQFSFNKSRNIIISVQCVVVDRVGCGADNIAARVAICSNAIANFGTANRCYSPDNTLNRY